MDLYRQQARNRRWTVAIIVLFFLFFAFLGLGFDFFLLHLGRGGLSFPVATPVSLVVAGIMTWAAYAGGVQAVLASCRARPADPAVVEEKTLRNCVEEMAIAAGLPCPGVYVIPDPDLNAFAAGRDPAHAVIAVTEGCLAALTRDELQGVVAHELSHIRNYDTRLLTLMAALLGAVILLSDWAQRALRGMGRGGGGSSGGGRGRGGAGILLLLLFVLWVIAIIVAPIVGQMLAMAVSRRREFLADASGAELNRNPEALAKALGKIEAAVEPTRSIKRGTAHMCIADPLGKAMGLHEGFMADLMATHPPIARRIEVLRQMAYIREKAGWGLDVNERH